MNQIAIFGVALLIAYSAGVPVNQEQNSGNSAINKRPFISVNATQLGLNDICLFQGYPVIGKKGCEQMCPCMCKSDSCGGYDSCKQHSRLVYKCFCKNPKNPSNNEGVLKDLLSSLAQNEQNGEVAANH